MTLQRRLERLEARAVAEAEELNFVFITQYEAGDDDADAARGEVYKIVLLGNPGFPPQTFERLPGETEAAFTIRAGAHKTDSG